MRRADAWLATGLAVAGGAALVLTYGHTWVCGGGGLLTPGPAEVETLQLICRPGAEAVPDVRVLGWAALAGLLAVAATRGAARRLVGALLALVGLAAGVLVGRFLLDPGGTFHARQGIPGPYDGADATRWAYLAFAGAVAVTVAGVVVAVRGPRWPAMGGRYDRRPAADPAAAMWEDLDRGVDPTR